MPQSSPLIRTMPPNTQGRDYVVGDIHGMAFLVYEALAAVGFDPATDRLFSVGDLIDRGPDVEGCLRLLNEPWFFSVRGNHEHLLNLAVEGWPVFCAPEDRPSTWFHFVGRNLLNPIYQHTQNLPLVIEIPTEQGPVGIIHADVPPGLTWSQFKVLIEAENIDARRTVLWDRERVRRGGLGLGPVEGVWRIFAGHTVSYGGVGFYDKNFFAIDPAAIRTGWKRACLTFADVTAPAFNLIAPITSGARFNLCLHAPTILPAPASPLPYKPASVPARCALP